MSKKKKIPRELQVKLCVVPMCMLRDTGKFLPCLECTVKDSTAFEKFCEKLQREFHGHYYKSQDFKESRVQRGLR